MIELLAVFLLSGAWLPLPIAWAVTRPRRTVEETAQIGGSLGGPAAVRTVEK